jgi:putative phosphoribosyl transferase
MMEKTITIPFADFNLEGELIIPDRSNGLVIFAHGSGSSRHSPRNRYVAGVLQEAGLSTLLFDLLTSREDEVDSITAVLRFNIPLLADRLTAAVDWAVGNKETGRMSIGCFGASTGAAAALVAAAERPDAVKAVVSRGGRPDLAGDALPGVKAPVLLIVGGLDTQVIELNRQAASRIKAVKEISIVPGASHLFEEPGTLPQAAQLAAKWFRKYLL